MPVYWPQKQKVLLNVPDRDSLVRAIPGAQKARVNGVHPVVMADHAPRQARLLRELGHPIACPALMHYNWPIKPGQAPFEAQRATVPFLASHSRAYNTSDMGTGKTRSTIWSYDILRIRGEVRSMLVTCPKSIMTDTWMLDVMENTWHLKVVVLSGSRQRKLKLLAQPADIYIVNHDGVKNIVEELMARRDIDLVAVDELTGVARKRTNYRWEALDAVIGAGDRMVWGMSAAPRPNAPTDVWAACRLITPENISDTYGVWEMQVMQRTRNGLRERKEASKLCEAALQPAIRFTMEDCNDLPPCTKVSREVDMSPSQRSAYAEMEERLRIEISEEEKIHKITAFNASAKMHKLLQICCGTLIYADRDDRDEEGKPRQKEVSIDFGPRAAEVATIVRQAVGKVIVFIPYTSALHRLAERLSDSTTVAVMHGQMSTSDRNDVLHAFKFEATPQVLVAQPKCMAHGLSLVVASDIVWFAPVQDNDTYLQANGRAHRPGQRNASYIIKLHGTKLERDMYASLERKGRAQDVLLQAMRG